MKKLLFFSMAFTAGLGLSAQNLPQQEASEDYQEGAPKNGAFNYRPESSAQTLIWSEDFANGIPQDWTQNGTPAQALWEYRGPNTAPPDSVGSRGCWAGPNQSGNLGDPINSPTRSNGFMIFDSDFLHSNGDRATNGQGTVPAPHVGRLRTDTIDLSGQSGAELGFYMYARRFQAAWYVAISTDGGVTFPDSVEVFPASELPVNSSTDQNAYYRANISNYVANESEVVLEFVFDGSVSNSNGSGRYYWMIDDIEIVTPPENSLLFTRATAPGTTGEAPEHDVIFDGEASYPKYMHIASSQQVPITFDSNIYNYGTNTQTNVGLEVEVWDGTNLITTLTSPTVASLSSFDTAYYTTLTTNAWTPSADGAYTLVYKAVSDSLTSATTTTADTFNIWVGDDQYGLDDRVADNYFGTNTGTNGMIAIGVLYHLENGDQNGLVYLDGVEMQMSCLTDSTADMEIAIYDSAGFVFNTGFPSSSSPLFSKVFTFDGTIPCNLAYFSFQDASGMPVALPEGSYYVIASLFPNATDGVIRFANSTNWSQPSYASVFQNQNGSWFSGFSNSTTYEAPHYRVKVTFPNTLAENTLDEFKVFPNPSTGDFSVELSEAGHYYYRVLGVSGTEYYRSEQSINSGERLELDLDLPNGVYFLQIVDDEGRRRTEKLSIRR